MKKFSQFTPDEDYPLLISWHRGDFSAFETLIWKYQKRVFNLALILTGVEKTACEVVENSFFTAYHNIKSLKSTGRFSCWLVGLALKECRGFNDYRSKEPELPAEPALHLDDESSYAAALRRKLELCIRELPSELGEVILLRYVRGYSLDSVEEILQISGDMVLSRLFEAQETLACWLRSGTDDPAELAAMKTAESSIHPEIRRNFSAYLDNSVEGDEKELTKAHLMSCGSCREALAELEWMVEDIKRIPDVEPPDWLPTSIMQKVKSSPVKPDVFKAPRHLKLEIAVAALVMAAIGFYSYYFQRESEPEPELQSSENQSVSSPPVPQKAAPPESGFTASPQGVFMGAPITKDDRTRADKPAGLPSFPLPAALPSERTLQSAPPFQPGQPAAGAGRDQPQKRENPEAMQPGLVEWGDSQSQTGSLQKKAPLSRARGGEVAVELSTSDAVAAAHDIERAVAAIGGKINGRAYSGGNDIIYTSVEVDKFFELMGRLGKVGRIQELPLLPEGAEGSIDLVIRW